jgi:hypothetical protein
MGVNNTPQAFFKAFACPQDVSHTPAVIRYVGMKGMGHALY